MGGEPGRAASGRAPRAWLCYQFGEDRALRSETAWLSQMGLRYRRRGAAGSEAAALERSRRCDYLLFYVTPRSVESDACLEEIAVARADGRAVVAVELEPVAWPPRLHGLLREATVLRRHALPAPQFRRVLYAALTAAGAAAPPPLTPPPRRAGSTLALLAGGAAAVFALVGGAWTAEQLRDPPLRLPEASQLEPGAGHGLSLDEIRRPRRANRRDGGQEPGLRFLGNFFPPERIDMELQDAPLEEALIAIADRVDLKLVSLGRLQGRVSTRIEATPWYEVLDALARQHALAVQVTEDTIYVAPLPDPASGG